MSAIVDAVIWYIIAFANMVRQTVIVHRYLSLGDNKSPYGIVVGVVSISLRRETDEPVTEGYFEHRVASELNGKMLSGSPKNRFPEQPFFLASIFGFYYHSMCTHI